jgi:hypothetical protein
MTMQPGHCFVCGLTPVDDHGNVKPAIDLERDYDWGDNAYLCLECANLIATLIDRPSPEEITKVTKERDKLKRQNKELLAKVTGQGEDLDKIRQGSSALKRVRASG